MTLLAIHAILCGSRRYLALVPSPVCPDSCRWPGKLPREVVAACLIGEFGAQAGRSLPGPGRHSPGMRGGHLTANRAPGHSLASVWGHRRACGAACAGMAVEKAPLRLY